MRNTQRTFDGGSSSRENARSVWRKPALKMNQRASRKNKLVAVRFEFQDDRARSVCIVGTFNDWDPKTTPMLKTGAAKWTKEFLLPPGSYEYQYVVDGRWINDPHAVKSTPNPFGGRNSVFVVEQHNTKSEATTSNRATRRQSSRRKGDDHDR